MATFCSALAGLAKVTSSHQWWFGARAPW